MKIKFFSDTNTALLEFADNAIEETREISENVYIDLDKKGNMVNMTIEHAREAAHFPDISFQQIDEKDSKEFAFA